jgi:uncharacterized coiled-coil protein SlyX
MQESRTIQPAVRRITIEQWLQEINARVVELEKNSHPPVDFRPTVERLEKEIEEMRNHISFQKSVIESLRKKVIDNGKG